MASFDLTTINSALTETNDQQLGLDLTGKSLKLDNADDAKEVVEAIASCRALEYLTLRGNTIGVAAAEAIGGALANHPELKYARWSDIFTGRLKTEIPRALMLLGEGMIKCGVQLTELDLSDNAFGPIGVEGLAKILQSTVCRNLKELRLNNNGLGIKGGNLLADALMNSGEDTMPHLKVFIAGRNRLENEGAKALSVVFKKMGSLEEISMPQNGIYHVGIKALSKALKHNPNLRLLNLNDNTVGFKGAVALVEAFPWLGHLKDVNLGDCLLKSAGAMTLARGFRDYCLPLETINLGFNEIGRQACLDVAEAIISADGSNNRLKKVILTGNSIGGADNKKKLYDMLGPSAEISDDEDGSDDGGSDDGNETGSENESEEEEKSESEHSEMSDSKELYQENIIIRYLDTTLDMSGLQEVELDVTTFLKSPTMKNFRSLGDNAAAVIDAHLQTSQKSEELIQMYVEAVLKVSGLTENPSSDETSRSAAASSARQLYQKMIEQSEKIAFSKWSLSNSMLVGLGLLKSEEKNYKLQWDLAGCYSVLSSVITEPYFPGHLRETLLFFIQKKKDKLKIDPNLFPNL